MIKNKNKKKQKVSLEAFWGTSTSNIHHPTQFLVVYQASSRNWWEVSICTGNLSCTSLDLANCSTCGLLIEKYTCGLTLYLNRSCIYYPNPIWSRNMGEEIHELIMMLVFFYPLVNSPIICMQFLVDIISFSFHWVKIMQLIMALVNILSYCPLKIIVYNIVRWNKLSVNWAQDEYSTRNSLCSHTKMEC